MRGAALAVLSVLAGCRAAAPPPASTPVAAAASPAPTALPPGVLAERPGAQGVVRIEERGGLRVLTIGGVVQGAEPLSGSAPQDPIVDLVLAMRPQATRVLVIGLGTGRTATTFAGRGLAVEAVELEPAVVELARAHFGYRGTCHVGDGLSFLKDASGTWDVILVDAYSGGDPGPLFAPAALSLAARRADLVAARLTANPAAPEVLGALRSMGLHHALFGSGVGSERQTVYLFGAKRPLQVAGVEGLPVFPIAIPGQGRPVALAPDGGQNVGGGVRRVTLTGYVVRLAEDGTLALDLPHWEMGAVRYRLRGNAVEALAAQLPPNARFPTSGEIGSDGDTSRTLKALLGGGDVMRSDTRFSPLVATVEGTARFRAAVDPDLVFGGRRLEDRASPATESLLPYGGVLYELDVERVVWTFTHAAWKRLDERLRPLAAAAARRFRAGDFAGGRRAMAEYDVFFRAGVGERVTMLAAWRDLEPLRRGLAGAAAGASAFSAARACDEAGAIPANAPGGWSNPHLEGLRQALQACAVAGYEKAIATKEARSDEAIRRLKGLLDSLESTGPRRKTRDALEARHPGLEPLHEPPAAD